MYLIRNRNLISPVIAQRCHCFMMLRYVTVDNNKRRKTSEGSSSSKTMAQAKPEVLETGDPTTVVDPVKNVVGSEVPNPGASATSSGFQFKEIKGDLFNCQSDVSLAHCVSADLHMGKGIAVLFKKKFRHINQLQNQGKKVGEVATLKVHSRYIYNLITKEKYWLKPTYNTLQSSLEAMKIHCGENKVSHVAMPMIGCGLDRLQWDKVKTMIQDLFKDMDITISIYYL